MNIIDEFTEDDTNNNILMQSSLTSHEMFTMYMNIAEKYSKMLKENNDQNRKVYEQVTAFNKIKIVWNDFFD